MFLYKQVPTERLSGFGGFLKSPRDFKSVESVKSVRNKKPTRIARMTRMERLARREKGVPYGQEIEQIYSKSFKFVRFGAICVISREATPFNPMNLLNHPKGICFKNEKMKE